MSRQLRKQHLEIKGNEENREIPENIPEDSLVDILDAIHSKNSSTEKLIVPKSTKKKNSKNEKKKKIIAKKKQEEKSLLKKKSSNKQIEEGS